MGHNFILLDLLLVLFVCLNTLVSPASKLVLCFPRELSFIPSQCFELNLDSRFGVMSKKLIIFDILLSYYVLILDHQ